MNRTLIKKIIDVLEGRIVPLESLGFNMEFFVADEKTKDVDRVVCGTTACIAGWAVALGSSRVKYVRDLIVIDDFASIEDEAARLLELGDYSWDDKVYALFHADTAEKPLYQITRKEAAAVLRHLLKTGEVDWSII